MPEQCYAVIKDTVNMKFEHPFSHKKCSFKCTQILIIPAFSMTAHKAQGQTLDCVIIDLESCKGTEAPYVMVSQVTSLQGLLILRPFQKKKIQSHQSEDVRQELKQIKLLCLQTIMKTGNTIESAAPQEKLSNTNFRDRIGQDESANVSTNHNMTLATRQLQQLQTDNLCLTGPSTTLSSAAQI